MWSKPDAINSAYFALGVAKHALEYYEEFFNISYPLSKLGKNTTSTFSAPIPSLNMTNKTPADVIISNVEVLKREKQGNLIQPT